MLTPEKKDAKQWQNDGKRDNQSALKSCALSRLRPMRLPVRTQSTTAPKIYTHTHTHPSARFVAVRAGSCVAPVFVWWTDRVIPGSDAFCARDHYHMTAFSCGHLAAGRQRGSNRNMCLKRCMAEGHRFVVSQRSAVRPFGLFCGHNELLVRACINQHFVGGGRQQ